MSLGEEYGNELSIPLGELRALPFTEVKKTVTDADLSVLADNVAAGIATLRPLLETLPQQALAAYSIKETGDRSAETVRALATTPGVTPNQDIVDTYVHAGAVSRHGERVGLAVDTMSDRVRMLASLLGNAATMLEEYQTARTRADRHLGPAQTARDAAAKALDTYINRL